MRLNPWSAVVLAALAALLITTSASAQVRYVHPDGADGNDGDSGWGSTQAWQTLRHALDELNTNGGFTEIWVAMGESGHVYTPHDDDPDISFLINEPVVIRGGFEGWETDKDQRSPGAVSVLSGDLPDSSDWAVRIMKIGVFDDQELVLLDALKFVGPGYPGDPQYISGGIETLTPEFPGENDVYGSLIVQSCRFEATVAEDYGGAIRASNRLVRLRDSAFSECTAKDVSQGGGTGGAVSIERGTLRAARCTFTDNFAGFSGGAIGTSLSSAVIVNCDFRGNVVKTTGAASGGGGAIFHSPDLYPE